MTVPDEERVKYVSEFEKGQARLQRLRVEASDRRRTQQRKRLRQIGQQAPTATVSWHSCSKNGLNSVDVLTQVWKWMIRLLEEPDTVCVSTRGGGVLS